MEKMMLGNDTAAKILTEDDVKRYIAKKMFEINAPDGERKYPGNVFFYLDDNGDMCTPFSYYNLGSNGKIYYPVNKESYDYNIQCKLYSKKDIIIPTSYNKYKTINAPNISFFKSKTSTSIHASNIYGNFSIPKYVTNVDIYRVSSNSSISVDKGNPVYDSRDNCNAIIKPNTGIIINDRTTDKMIKGNQRTVIPNTVTTIDTDCFVDCVPAVIPYNIISIKSHGISVSGKLTTTYYGSKYEFRYILESNQSIFGFGVNDELRVKCDNGSLLYTRNGVTEL